jgi:glycine cleavage system P protein (glycine dehydrogenase) subunit 1
MQYIPLTQDQREQILKEIGVSTVEELFADIPVDLFLTRALDLPPAMSEWAVQNHLSDLADMNADLTKTPCFLGAGAYRHYIPAVVSSLAGRPEFVTAYTPYQPEVSQGTLQALFEYQTMITQLTDMPIANASVYDGAMAAAEAALLATRVKRKSVIAVSRAIAPGYRQTLHTYSKYQNLEIIELPFDDEGRTDMDALKAALQQDLAAVLVQSPNFFGVIEDVESISSAVKTTPALMVSVISEATSLGILKPPGECGADIACGDAHSFGLPVSFGGPYLGFMTVTESLLRQMPGRVVGWTKDRHGKPGFVNTLSTREQHIRRERATSNICTNQALCATTAGIYMATLGRHGLRELAQQNMKKAAYLKQNISNLENCSLAFTGPTFNEFVFTSKIPVKQLNQKLRDNGIIGGYDLSKDYPELDNTMLVCATELLRKDDIDRFTAAIDSLGRTTR